MKRVLGLGHLSMYGLGMIVGAGIYSVIGKAAGAAGESLWLSFIIAGLAAMMTALSYAELSSMFPKVGAEYHYLRSIFPQLPLLAFLCGSMMIFAGLATTATVATAFSGYLHEVLKVPVSGVSFAVILFFCLLSIWGLKEASWFNTLFTTIEISGLILFIYFGVQSVKFAKNLSFVITGGTLAGASMIIFAFFGFENIVNFAEETREPEKKLPRAILISLFGAGVLYILVSLSALALSTPDDLSNTDAPLAAALKGQVAQAAIVVGSIAVFSTANTVLISVLSTSRIILSMARENDLPNFFTRTGARRQTPWAATLLVLILSVVLLPVGGVEVLASASSFATIIAFILINLALIHLRYTKPEMKRPFRVPVSVGSMPLPSALAVVSSFALMFFFSKPVYILGFSFLALVFAIYLFRKWFLKRIS